MKGPTPQAGQFSLRWLFIAVTACSLCACIYRLTGWFETAAIAIALVLVGLCLSQWTRGHRWWRGGLVTLSFLIVWMVGVDFSVFHVGCDHCWSHWDSG